MEKWTLGILTLLISLTISLNSVFAKSGGGGRPVPVPEPEPVPEAEPTTEEILDAMLGVNRYE